MIRIVLCLLMMISHAVFADNPSITIQIDDHEKIRLPSVSGFTYITDHKHPTFKLFDHNDDEKSQNNLLAVAILDTETTIAPEKAKQNGILNPYSSYIAIEKLIGEKDSTLSSKSWELRKKESKNAFRSMYKNYKLSDLKKDKSAIAFFEFSTLTQNRQLVPLGYIDTKNYLSTFTVTHVLPTQTTSNALSVFPTTCYSITQLYLHHQVLIIIVHHIVREQSDLTWVVDKTTDIAQQIIALNK